MRISTSMIFDRGIAAIQQQSSGLLQTSLQISTGRRILTPADDPIGSVRALGLTQARAINTQFTTNQGVATDGLNLVEARLTGVGDILQNVRDRVLEAGNAVLSRTELGFIATDLRSQFDAMLALANTRDASGEYLFSGYKVQDQAFNGTLDGGVSYGGDQGTRTIQVSSSRFMPLSLSGERVFDGTFQTLATFVQALEDPNSDVSAAVATALGGVDQGLDQVLTARAQIGSQLVELDQLGSIGSELDLQYATTLSGLQDLNFEEAISRLTQQQTLLQASQQAFLRVTGLSLFNFLN